jgi:hypothetical protein
MVSTILSLYLWKLFLNQLCRREVAKPGQWIATGYFLFCSLDAMVQHRKLMHDNFAGGGI